MADRGEQRLRKQMYKPKQFQKKKRMHPRPYRAAVDANKSNGDNNIEASYSTSEENESDAPEQIHVTTSSGTAIEQLLTSSSEYNTLPQIKEVPPQENEDQATDLDQFLAELEQPHTTPLNTGT